jgi:hypothetical protein
VEVLHQVKKNLPWTVVDNIVANNIFGSLFGLISGGFRWTASLFLKKKSHTGYSISCIISSAPALPKVPRCVSSQASNQHLQCLHEPVCPSSDLRNLRHQHADGLLPLSDGGMGIVPTGVLSACRRFLEARSGVGPGS